MSSVHTAAATRERVVRAGVHGQFLSLGVSLYRDTCSHHPTQRCSAHSLSLLRRLLVCVRVCACVLCGIVRARGEDSEKKKWDAGCRELHHVLFDVTRSSALTVCVLRSFSSFTVILRGNCGLRE